MAKRRKDSLPGDSSQSVERAENVNRIENSVIVNVEDIDPDELIECVEELQYQHVFQVVGNTFTR